jgi:hypothetical protein
MKKSQKVLVLVISASVWIFAAISLYQNFEEFFRENRYEYNDLIRVLPPTASPLNAKLNNDLVDLVSRYQKHEISVMDLSTITPFAWDRVYIFADFQDFMGYRDIDRILGKSWRNIDSCDYAVATTAQHNVRDTYSIFIFTHEKTVIHCLLYNALRASVYTNSTDTETGISRENALFVIDNTGIIRPIEK